MISKELRKNFLNFFEKKGHKIVPSSSLLPKDPSVLFTTAGMQQFKPYYLGEESPHGPNVASCQKCFRTSDIDEVGDESHLTFLEMLGNFSFGGYFKDEAINLAYDFLFKELKLSKEKAAITIFEGDREIPFDEESAGIWKKLGVPENKIKKGKKADNFWGPTGKEGPCGPTTEIHFDKTEIWNIVFNEYYQDEKGKLTPLKQKGVDTGMGLERLAMIIQGKNSVFETDLFEPIISSVMGGNEKNRRIIADHIKGAVFLISEGILPSNIERGYVLRRILRRAIRYGKLLNLPKNFLIPLAQKTIEIYQDIYFEVKSNETDILTVIQNEEEKFGKTLDQGEKEFKKWFKKPVMYWREPPEDLEKTIEETPRIIPGFIVFRLFTTYGFPVELIKEMAEEKGLQIDEKGFEIEMKKHQEISRAGAEKKFGGGGEFSAKLHTATHLLHAALRQILGTHVKQMGSDITSQRLRFDFSHPQKMTESELKQVEDLVNQKIKEDLEVKKEEMPYNEALKSRALAFFKEKYPEKVTVYSITELPKEAKVEKRTSFSSTGDFSREICAGPHVNRTSQLGCFKITKEESVGAGIRRIRAILI